MIKFDFLESQVDALAASFKSAQPYEHVAIDGVCDESKLLALYEQIPDPVVEGINKSRDYVFAKNKYEKSGFKDISPLFTELHDDLMSERFQRWLQRLTGQPVFVDPAFHGGGLHQGGPGSFLDMHVDFNTHPVNHEWFRNLNILLYLNPGWTPEFKGELKLRHKDHEDSTKLIEPLFNRCVVMFTRGYTVHGYDAINFPEGRYRRSLASYAYTPINQEQLLEHRSTVWYPETGGVTKSTLGRLWPTLVRIKGQIFGSSTSKNK